jgi:hypothetical protein
MQTSDWSDIDLWIVKISITSPTALKISCPNTIRLHKVYLWPGFGLFKAIKRGG